MTIPYPALRAWTWKVALSLLVIPVVATYPFSFLWMDDLFLKVAVISGSICFFCLCWYRWQWAMHAFVFSIPLLNTIAVPTEGSIVRGIAWPGVNVSAIMIAAMATAWVYRRIWGAPLGGTSHTLHVTSTPFDPLMFLGGLLVLVSVPIGVARFNNLVTAGFYHDLAAQLLRIPFFDVMENYLCFTRTWQFVQVGIAFYLVCSSVQSRQQWRALLWLIVIAGVFVGVYGIWQYNMGFRWVGTNWYFRRINATFNGPDGAATYFATYICIGYALLFATPSLLRKVLLFCALGVAFGALWLTGTRTAFYVLMLVLIVVLVCFLISTLVRQRVLRYGAVALIILVPLLGAGQSLMFPDRGLMALITRSQQFQRLTDGVRGFSLNHNAINAMLSFRFYHWTAAVNLIKRYPWSGAGIGTLDKFYPLVRLPDDGYKTAFAHAQYLDVLAELGPLALVICVLLYCVAVVVAWKTFCARGVSWRIKTLQAGFLGAIYVTFLTNFFTSSLYYVPGLQLWTMLQFALVVVNYRLYVKPDPPPLTVALCSWKQRLIAAARRSRAATITVGVVLVLFCSGWAWAFYHALRDGELFFHNAYRYTKLDRVLEYGIFGYESDQSKNKFARTAADAYKPVRIKDRFLRIFLRADHPDTREIPVRVTAALDDDVIVTAVLSNREWHLCRVDLSDWLLGRATNDLARRGLPATFHLHSDRTWNPVKTARGTVNRDYGVDLGAIEWGYSE